jgi:hypothetical protein
VLQAASHYADYQSVGGWPVEPGVTVASGIDYITPGRYNVRVQGALYFMRPRGDHQYRSPGSGRISPTPNSAPGVARDYSIIVAVRQGARKQQR